MKEFKKRFEKRYQKINEEKQNYFLQLYIGDEVLVFENNVSNFEKKKPIFLL